ncbi:hypothetical protein [Enterococcus termitis]|nr:hypothetical protein [Enterococcus termitis]
MKETKSRNYEFLTILVACLLILFQEVLLSAIDIPRFDQNP